MEICPIVDAARHLLGKLGNFVKIALNRIQDSKMTSSSKIVNNYPRNPKSINLDKMLANSVRTLIRAKCVKLGCFRCFLSLAVM